MPAPDGEVLLDYVHPDGPRVTHMRGLLLVNAINNLKSWGVYDRYLEALSEKDRDWLVSTIVTSWVPIEAAELHYRTASQLNIPNSTIEDAGRRMAVRVAEMYLSPAIKSGRAVEAFAAVMAKNDKMWERMYQGGACLVVRLGPAAFQLEDYGNPLVQYHPFRHAYAAYMSTLASLFRKSARVYETDPSRPDEPALATRFSW